jgi:hypothetical protein
MVDLDTALARFSGRLKNSATSATGATSGTHSSNINRLASNAKVAPAISAGATGATSGSTSKYAAEGATSQVLPRNYPDINGLDNLVVAVAAVAPENNNNEVFSVFANVRRAKGYTDEEWERAGTEQGSVRSGDEATELARVAANAGSPSGTD